MTTYYFDATGGNDGAAGTTPATAWQTLSKFRTEESGGTFQPDDFILFKAGETWITDIYRAMQITTCNGTSGHPITISRYGHGPDPIIDGDDDVNHHNPLRFYGVDYWDVEYLELTNFNRDGVVDVTWYSTYINLRYLWVHDSGNGLSNWCAGIVVAGDGAGNGPHHCTVEYCRVTNIDGEGIYIGTAGAADDTHDITVRGCFSYGNLYEGIECKSSAYNITITGCFVKDNASDAGSESDISLGAYANSVLEDTRVESSHPTFASVWISQYTTPNSGADCTVRRCTIVSTVAYAMRVQGDGHTIEHNKFEGGTTACIYLRNADNSHNHTIRYNRFRDWGSYAAYWDAANAAGYTFDYNHYCDGSADVWYYNGAARTLAYVQGTVGKETNGDASCPTGTYYVDSDAGADGTGTFGSPWNTLEHLNELDRGDALILRGDAGSYQVYNEEIFISLTGTAANPFTMEPYTDEQVELRSPSGQRILSILSPYVEIDGQYRLLLEGQDYADRLVQVDHDHFTLENAELKSCTERAIHGSDRADSMTLDRLTIHDVSAAFVLDGPTTVAVQRCVAHTLLASASDPNEAYQSAFVILNGASSVNLYNNTVEGSPENSLYFSNLGLVSIVIRNNIFKDCGNIENEGAAGLTYDHNCWYNCTETLAGAGDVTSDPLFTDEAGHDYTLQAGSPCIDAGVDVGLWYDGSAPDMGAFEYTLLFPSPELPIPVSVSARAGFRVLVADRTGRILAELQPALVRVSWRLNNVGRATFVLAKTDDKATEDNLRFGNYMLIQFSNGLPDWGGMIDTPRTWGNAEIACTAYSGEYLLALRQTDRGRYFTSATVGYIYEQLIVEANAVDATGLTIGNVWGGGDPHSPEYHFKNLLTIVQDGLCRRLSDADFYVEPAESGGFIIFTAHLYERRGGVKTGVALLEGHNVSRATLKEQGSIRNWWDLAGEGTTWGTDRLTSHAEGLASIAEYGLRQASRVYSDTSVQASLDDTADNELALSETPVNVLTLEAVNLQPAAFADYDVGDSVQVKLQTYGFGGYEHQVRLVTREYNPETDSCALVVEEDD